MKTSAGILLYRMQDNVPEFFLVHPGGPFFVSKDQGWWTIPKGEVLPGEELLHTALREMKEETGYHCIGPFTALEPVVQKGGKKVFCWAAPGTFDAKALVCNSFEMEWPPRSGKFKSFPEVDKAGWFKAAEALTLINQAQKSFIIQLTESLATLRRI